MTKRDADDEGPPELTTDGAFRCEPTRVGHAYPLVSPLDAKKALFLAYGRMLELASVAAAPAYVVALVDAHAHSVRAAVIEHGHSLTVGRHARCKLQLDAPESALRCLTALVVREGDRVSLRLWELRAGLPFRTRDGRTHYALEADGPVFVTYGRYALWFLPVDDKKPWPSKASSAWRRVDAHSSPGQEESDPVPDAAHGSRREDAHAKLQDVWEPTRVTPLRPPVDPSWAPEAFVFPYALVRIETAKAKGCWSLSLDDLTRGILIGRYARCDVAANLNDDGVSRVHLLLVRIGGRIWAIDTASTNGVQLAGQPIDAGELDSSACLDLCPKVKLRLELIEHPEA